MAKEKFNWKALFVNDEGESKDKTVVTSSEKTTSFPSETESTTKFPEPVSMPTSVKNSVLSTVIEMYEAGFESLNKPGYDFYEFFKAIKAVGSNDASVYKMAYTMASSVDKNITKASLLEQSDFYIKEIDKVHQQYQSKGNAKKTQIQSGLKTKKTNLSAEVSQLEKQILQLQTQISDKKNQLLSIDSNLINDVSDIEQKIVANDLAKSKILETIGAVVEGIKNNL